MSLTNSNWFTFLWIGAVVQGHGVGGIFAASINILMLAFGADAVTAAFYDFMIAIIVEILAIGKNYLIKFSAWLGKNIQYFNIFILLFRYYYCFMSNWIF